MPESPALRHKVIAYLTRPGAHGPELLVFEHRDYPDAGVQVPAGSVEPGEAAAAGALRELAEEAGLSAAQVRLLGKLAETYEPEHRLQRHVFAFAPAAPLPDRWTHTVHGSGEDAGLVFEFYWLPIQPRLRLAGGQERFLHLLPAGPAFPLQE